jgi:hypothetical protein
MHPEEHHPCPFLDGHTGEGDRPGRGSEMTPERAFQSHGFFDESSDALRVRTQPRLEGRVSSDEAVIS